MPSSFEHRTSGRAMKVKWPIAGGDRPELVEATGFEPATPRPPVWCATRLRYASFSVGACYFIRAPTATDQTGGRPLRIFFRTWLGLNVRTRRAGIRIGT